MVIMHPGARTRAVYAWEREEIDPRSKKWKMSKRSLLRLSEKVWGEMKWGDHYSPPELCIIPNSRATSACWGRGLIELREADMHPSILLHELTHARGYGAGVQEHPVEFVLKAIELYSYYLGWSYNRLFAQAALRRLV